MSDYHEPSVEELRQESERSRAALTNTVDQLGQKLSETTDDLKARISPAYLKHEAKTYIHDKRIELLGSLEKSARDNPLQTLAIGAAIAYPLLGVAKRIPLPMMLIGAGLWMSRRGSTFPDTDVKNENRAHENSSVLEERQQVGRANAVKEGLSAAVGQAQDSVTAVAKTVADAISSGAESAKDSISTATDELSKRTVQVGRHSHDKFVGFADRNPLVVGGIGLALGMFLASSLPTSRIENQTVGKASDRVKGKARELASDAIDGAKDKTVEIAESISALADKDGLNKDAISEGVDRFTDKVVSVVDRGVSAALTGKVASRDVRGTNPDPYLNGDRNAVKK